MSRTIKRTRAKQPAVEAKRARGAAVAPVESRVIREETPGSHLPAGATRTVGGPPASSEKRGKYVYCIVRADEALRFGPIGFGTPAGEVYTVLYEDIAAVVSDAPIEVLDATRENVLAHERVNEAVMRYQTVIPMSFGTVFKTRDDIVELLRGAHSAFQDVLTKMEIKVEFGLKVLWDRDAMIRQIEHDDEDIRRLKSEIATQKGSTYFARVQYGRLVDGALQSRSEQYVGEIFEALRDVCVASRANKPIGDKMIMNAAFLVERDRESAFDARVKALGGKYDTLTFRYTGPWPPYNFVNIRLKLERAK
ncbi:MAG TPA: GvpL/GvpF family gas vesicle protein [Methylomirabilota bacterium]|nr:GvpL/GvpF family gas vesicle protein [Methylomirabilota bacterium]